jgi:hypothetical protein
MSDFPAERHLTLWPRMVAVAAGLAVALLFGHLLMRMPIDYGDNFTEIAGTYRLSLRASLGSELADPGYYFRPLEIVWRYLIAFGIRDGLFGYNLAMSAAWTLVVVAFALVCAPRSGRDIAAFLVALAVFAGHHGTRATWEFATVLTYGLPLLAVTLSIPLMTRPATSASQAAVVVLTLLSLLAKETGLVVAVLLIAGYALRMPGVRRSTVLTIATLVLAYLAFHFWTLPDLMQGDETRAKGVLQSLSNVLATLVMFWVGVPFDGVWSNAGRFLSEPWQWIQIAAGPPTLLLLVGGWRLAPEQADATDFAPDVDRRWFVLFAVTLLVSCALGFYITRHRLGAAAVPLLAYCVYLSMRVLLWRLDGVGSRLTPAPAIVTATAVAALACALLWPVRLVTGVEYVRALSGRLHADFYADAPARWKSLDDARRPFLVPFARSMDMLPWPRRDVPILDRLGNDIEYSVNR